MDADWFTILDRIEDFELEQASFEKWECWIQQFNILLRATSWEKLPDSRKVALLLMKCKGFLIVLNALEINDETIEFEELVSKVKQYLRPINARNVFFSRKQREDESFDNFARSLEALSHPCRFSDNKILRDVFLSNMNVKHSAIKQMFQSQTDPTFEEAVVLASAMVSQGCGVQSGLHIDVNSSSRSPPSLTLGASSPSLTNIRMMPCNVGVYDVQILNVSALDNMVYICPMSMMNTRKHFLDAFNVDMKKCQAPAVAPVRDNCYAALINSQWYRVRVLAIEEGRKAKVIAYDFGLFKLIPFSVFRNMPLDYLVVKDLMWAVSWRLKSIPQTVQPDAILNLKITQYKNNWQAELNDRRSRSPPSLMSSSGIDDSESYPNFQAQKIMENNRHRSAASDGGKGDYRQQRRSHEGGSSFQQRRSLNQETNQGRNDTKHNGHGAITKRLGRGCNSLPASSDTDHSEGTFKDSDIETIDSSRAKDSKQQPVRSGPNRNSRQNESSVSQSLHNQPNHGTNGNLSGRQPSTFQHSKSNGSANHCLESRNSAMDVGEPVLQSQPAFVPRSEAVSNGGIRNTSGSSRQPVEPTIQPARDSCPIPLNHYTQVRIIHRSEEGKLFCVPSVHIDELEAMCKELSDLGELGPHTLANPREGDLCLAKDEMGALLRAQVTKIHPTGLRAKIKYVDIGREEKQDSSELLELPKKYWDIPPYSFRIQVHGGVKVNEEDDIEVMPENQNENGVWNVKVRTRDLKETPAPPMNTPAAAQCTPRSSLKPAAVHHAYETAAAQPDALQKTLKPSSDRSRIADPPRRPRPPPIPRNTFSEIYLPYVGPEGIFALDPSKAEILANIQAKILEANLQPLQSPPEVDGLYVAPFEDELYRARVLEVLKNNQKCRVTFVDFGNEAEIHVHDMRCLPDELCGHINTFKIRFDPQSSVRPKSNDKFEVTPVVLQADGSWLVQLRGEPTSPGHALPDDEEVGPFERQRRP